MTGGGVGGNMSSLRTEPSQSEETRGGHVDASLSVLRRHPNPCSFNEQSTCVDDVEPLTPK